jgi:hypothetical protein
MMGFASLYPSYGLAMGYGISARAYLARAKQKLLEHTNESLFYAAFELRCCVESRQEEYATGIEFIKKKIKPWKIGETARRLEQLFDSNKIAKVTVSIPNADIFVLYHTPVSQRLYKASEKLGDLLHCMKEFKPDNNPFWSQTWHQVAAVYRDAWYSCQGQLITPPLRDHPFKVENPPTGLLELLERAAQEKLLIRTDIRYLDHPPKEWVCDLSLD